MVYKCGFVLNRFYFLLVTRKCFSVTTLILIKWNVKKPGGVNILPFGLNAAISNQ